MIFVTGRAQTLSVVFDTLGEGGDPYLVRLVDQRFAATGVPGGTGAAGFAALEVSDEVSLLVDGADPGYLIELAVRVPSSERAASIVSHLVGEAAARALGAAGRVTTVSAAVGEQLVTAGQLAQLLRTRELLPVPTVEALWLLEEAWLRSQLACHGLPSWSRQVVSDLHERLDEINGLVGTPPTALRTIDPERPAAELAPALTFALFKLARQLGPLGGRADQLEVMSGDRRRMSVEWDQVPLGVVDPREDTVSVVLERHKLRVEVPVFDPDAPDAGPDLTATILGPDRDEAWARVVLEPSGVRLAGEVAVARPPDELAACEVDVSAWPEDGWKDRRQLAIARARREGVRAMFHERRARTWVSSLDPCSDRAEASFRAAARRWAAAGDWWGAADLREEHDDALVRAAGAALAAGGPDDFMAGRWPTTEFSTGEGPRGASPMFVAEHTLDPRWFTGLEPEDH